MRKHIPNILTCLNLFCGSVAAVLVLRGHSTTAVWLLLAAGIFDVFDGLVARWLNVQSPFGKELDSLADAVSFGFVPGAILFMLMQTASEGVFSSASWLDRGVRYFPFVVTVFSVLRLAKFNLDKRQSVGFYGLPTPSNTLLIASLPVIVAKHPSDWGALILQPWVLAVIAVGSSLLMVSDLRLFSLKMKDLSFRSSPFHYLLLLSALILVPLFGFSSVPLLFILYILFSILHYRIIEKNTAQS